MGRAQKVPHMVTNTTGNIPAELKSSNKFLRWKYSLDRNGGLHKDIKKCPGKEHWRQPHLACSRKFLAFDFDGFETP